jgi:predicted secreted Zn-dependent protease
MQKMIKLSAICVVLLLAPQAKADLPVVGQYYLINAQTANDALNAIATQAPKNPKPMAMRGSVILGSTTFQWGDVKVFAQDTPSGCLVNKIEPTARLVMAYPKLKKVDDQEWTVRFEQFGNSVKMHEQKHVMIFQRSWNQLTSDLKKQENKVHAQPCDKYKKDLQGYLLSWPKTFEKLHEDLDQAEGHVTEENLRAAFGLR